MPALRARKIRGNMIIGLTGSIACGKTTVAKMFKRLGAYVIDADKIAHSLVARKDRKNLAGFIFQDKSALKELCDIIHPIIIEKINEDIKRHKNKKVIIIDAPLLIEAGFHRKCSKIIVVKAAQKTVLARLKKIGLSRSQFYERLQNQMPQAKKLKSADYVIDNNSSLNQTLKQVRDVWKNLLSVN